MTTRKPQRDPGSGLTPLDSTTLVHAETGEPIAIQPEPPRRRRTKLSAEPVPPRADVVALHEELFGAADREELARVHAGIVVSELRAQRNALDDELAMVRFLVRQHRSLFPRELVPTGLVARFDRVRDGIVENEREMAHCRAVLAPGVDEIRVLTPKRQRAQRAREARTVAVLEAARVQGRKEYATASGVVDQLLGPPAEPLVAASPRSPLAAARDDVRHPGHDTSQRVVFEGRPSMIFTGR